MIFMNYIVNMPKHHPGRLILLQWCDDHRSHPYPTMEEKAVLMSQTGMSLQQLNQWFVNHRQRAIKHASEQAPEKEDQDDVIPTFVEYIEELTPPDEVITKLIFQYFDSHAFDMLKLAYIQRVRLYLVELLYARTSHWRQMMFLILYTECENRAIIQSACDSVYANNPMSVVLDILYHAAMNGKFIVALSLIKAGLPPDPLELQNGEVVTVRELSFKGPMQYTPEHFEFLESLDSNMSISLHQTRTVSS